MLDEVEENRRKEQAERDAAIGNCPFMKQSVDSHKFANALRQSI